MSTFAELAEKPNTTKIVLLELDLAIDWTFWINHRAHVWKVSFQGTYPEILSFTSGWVLREITRIGSVQVDGYHLSLVSSIDEVQTNESSFYYDGETKTLYVHCADGDEPNIRLMFAGEVRGFTNHASLANRWAVHNDFPYDPRLLSIPALSKRKDPLFFGLISFEGGQARIDNTDGQFDTFGEDNDVFGNAARALMGFDDQAYASFRHIFSGYIEGLSIGRQEVSVSIRDKRAALTRELPPSTFDQTVYPDLKDGNVGKPIPLGYGVMRNVPVICTNEAEDPAPSDYNFKLFDTSDHAYGIKEISAGGTVNQVYVNGTAVATASVSLLNATFDIAAANYSPGDKVTCDCQGFVDSGSALIDNGVDVLEDLLTTYHPANFNANYFDLDNWETTGTPDIGLYVGKSRKLIEAIEDICATVLGTFLVMDDGRYAHRLYDPARAISQTVYREDLLEVPAVDYDASQVITSARIGYSRDWAAGDDEEAHLLLVDKSQKEALFRTHKVYRERFFPTLLTNSTAAQAFSDDVLGLYGEVLRTFRVRTKTQTIERVLVDMIQVAVKRAKGEFLGDVKAEVIGVMKDATGATVELECRLVGVV